MLTPRILTCVDEGVARLEPIRVGGVPSGLGTPDLYVVLFESEDPVARIDVYAVGSDCFAFEEAVLWHDVLVIGFGSHVHMISMQDSSVVTLELGSYFGHLSTTDDFLLVASGERLFRVERDRSVMWKSDVLGIDGVVVTEVTPATVRGKGEWDPPGGWRPL